MPQPMFFATHSANPYFNMATDEWMFSKVLDTPALVLLRLYSWDKGTITFGLNQRLESAVNQNLLNGTPLIRRITGGRALYHELSELTYSIAVNTEELTTPKLNGSLADSGGFIAQALVEFLSKIGISAQYVRQSSIGFNDKNALHTQHCFQSRARNEIVSGVRKIIASAQRRIGPSFLQHGSIKITDSSSHPAISAESSKLVTDSVIESVLSKDFERYSAQFRVSFGKSFGIDFKDCELTQSDKITIDSYQKNLEKNHLNKRDLIKQNTAAVGLYINAFN